MADRTSYVSDRDFADSQVGSSTAPGLDGSTLANQNIVVVLIQYRLGALGFFTTPSVSGNQAVKDIILALQTIKSDIASFGGDPSTITLAGQSSGASLITTLLATPSADTLFQRAIIQSAPLDFGDQSTSTAQAIGSQFLQALNCTTVACAQSAPVSSVLSAQSTVFAQAPTTNPAIAASLPLRPYVDGSLVKGACHHLNETYARRLNHPARQQRQPHEQEPPDHLLDRRLRGRTHNRRHQWRPAFAV